MAKYLGRGACEGCSAPVEVYSDRNNLAYYKCGPCGRKMTHSLQRESAKFVAKIDRHATEDDAPAASPAVPVVAAPTAAPAKSGVFGFGRSA